MLVPNTKKILRNFVLINQSLSRHMDKLLFPDAVVDGNRFFLDVTVPSYLLPGMNVLDVGGGKRPAIAPEIKEKFDLRVVGLDIDGDELGQAPEGYYDDTIVGDITVVRGMESFDAAICCTLLEHVQDTATSLSNITSFVRSGGLVLAFLPSRKAISSRINIIIPENIKKRMLFAIFPQERNRSGFPAYYDLCTPGDIYHCMQHLGLEIVEFRPFWASGYFSFFLPLYAAWRVYQAVNRVISEAEAAETFIVIGRKT